MHFVLLVRRPHRLVEPLQPLVLSQGNLELAVNFSDLLGAHLLELCNLFGEPILYLLVLFLLGLHVAGELGGELANDFRSEAVITKRLLKQVPELVRVLCNHW